MSQLTANDLKEKLKKKLITEKGVEVSTASNKDIYYALASIVNDEIMPKWYETIKRYQDKNLKQVYYLSMEFLIGRLLESNLLNSGLLNIAKEALEDLGFCSELVFAEERDAGLGNGGLGRLAACFLDSLASLYYPGHGFGIRYRYGLFEQRIIHGNQVELPDYWLKEPYPWETRKEEEAFVIQFHGKVHMFKRNDGSLEFKYENTDKVLAVPYDIPVLGYQNEVVNTLRLWSAEPVAYQEAGQEENSEFYHDLDHQHSIEQISGFLYPDDSNYEGKELRLKQQYFLVSSSIQNIIRSFKKNYRLPISRLPEKVVIQINDTHPSLAVPELMRILMDEERLDWDTAWEITTHVLAYTNHTTLSEALETWPEEMIQNLLPRIYMIIDEINERFCKSIWFDHKELRDKIPDLAVIAYGRVHMARLAIVGSFSVNGVARIHTEILKKQEMKDFYTLFPNKFNNKTNGITHRRWLLQVNPKLSNVISEAIGTQWIKRPKQLISLLKYSNDKALLEKFDQVKHENKKILANYIHQQTGILVDDQSIFDVQIKRLHEYKRQLLNIFHVIYLYNELKANPNQDVTPRTFIFGAKAAPSYHLAKEIIKLINTVASIVNYDKDINGKLKVIFLENYNVSLAEKIIPAADISEQISTASKEASGTGNMKMMMNGAVTLGTMDGANIEIYDLVGENNIFIFGLNADEVLDYYQNGGYNARDIYNTDDRVRLILDQLNQGEFGIHNIEFKDIFYNILYHNDPYFVLKDFEPYLEAHELAERAYRNRTTWMNMSVTNIAYSGKFSSDQTIREYATDIWKIKQMD
ncbi:MULTISPECIES: glycogen/starch/alpha-glucan phosphorylase [Bacillaceae]|uniref:glycogen/starch/alpha-glucan phosphorylase n=1 Tax=Bacillaceae TaxID=186817 RepID=UPI00062123E1|nr:MULTISPECIES: glycogen/starch/alpha-glucan phosphorylase [Bacillaceae]KKE79899.1 maltodextrin phosphorylase [Bacilli bacterium VT-13-104]PZD84106.1 glycogen/starch/alpha-glucan phosphorylase [Bacilli bacterium]MED4476173.1 glycogen/starch/alpha-glucan phosphorylase [Oceanobacillus caeni]PZD85467.1 glycogen/starch/alpha-glucan phosphorylase [Bacilli bacterium]PZD88241.1 glycogen/starch/alpha-glucan phosphorylase [Bacilli bacterium]